MAALMNNGNNQWMNNPFAYMMMLALFGMWGGGFGFGNRGDFGCQNAQNVEMQNQLQAIRSQLQDNQNSGLIIDAVRVTMQLLVSLLTTLTVTSTRCRMPYAVYRMQYSRLLDRLDSLLKE